MEYLTPVVAQEVFDYLRPDGQRGLFGMILGDAGQGIESRGAGGRGGGVPGSLSAGGRAEGGAGEHAREWARVRDTGVLAAHDAGRVWGDVIELLRTRPRGQGRPYDFTRREVYEALRSRGCLAGVDVNVKTGHAAQICEIDSETWGKPLALHGLPIVPGFLPGRVAVSFFDGTIDLKGPVLSSKEKHDGNEPESAGESN